MTRIELCVHFSLSLYPGVKFIWGEKLLFPSLRGREGNIRQTDKVSRSSDFKTVIHNPDNSVSCVTMHLLFLRNMTVSKLTLFI